MLFYRPIAYMVLSLRRGSLQKTAGTRVSTGQFQTLIIRATGRAGAALPHHMHGLDCALDGLLHPAGIPGVRVIA